MKALLQGRPFGHPLHPLLIHFPIAMFTLSLLLDVARLANLGSPSLTAASQICILIGIVTALIAAVAGFADYADIRRDDPAHRIATAHMVLNLIIVALYAASAWLRYRSGYHIDHPPPSALLIAFLAFILLAISGWLGGLLVYGHGVGVGRHRRHLPEPHHTIEVAIHDNGIATLLGTSALPEGGTMRVEADDTIFVIARSNGELCAFQEFCTHRQGPLSAGTIKDGQVTCPWHKSRFDVRTGKVTQGPAKIDLRTFPVEVLSDGSVRVRVTPP